MTAVHLAPIYGTPRALMVLSRISGYESQIDEVQLLTLPHLMYVS